MSAVAVLACGAGGFVVMVVAGGAIGVIVRVRPPRTMLVVLVAVVLCGIPGGAFLTFGGDH